VNNIANGGFAPPFGFSLDAAIGSALRPWPISMYSREEKRVTSLTSRDRLKMPFAAVHESVQARIRPSGHLGKATRVGSNRHAHPRDPPG
jgi:hypothetical protein